MLVPIKLAFLTILLIVLACVSNSLSCRLVPKTPHGVKRSGDNGYRISIGNNPTGYQPGKIYNGELYKYETFFFSFIDMVNIKLCFFFHFEIKSFSFW